MRLSGKIVLLAGNSFIGQHLTLALSEVLLQSGQLSDLVVVARSRVRNLPEGVTEMNADIGDVDIFEHILSDCSLLIHLASESTPGSFAGKPLHEAERNLIPSIQLFELLHKFPNVDLIYVSSGGAIYGDSECELFSETMPVKPLSYYAAAKASLEVFIHALVKQSPRIAVVLRPSNIYGPGQPYKPGFGIVPTVFNSLTGGGPITVWGANHTERDYLYIDDFISLFIRLIEFMPDPGVHTYNVGSGKGCSLHRLLTTIEKVSDMRVSRKDEPLRTIDVRKVILNVTKVESEFGWCASTSLISGLNETWDCWLELSDSERKCA